MTSAFAPNLRIDSTFPGVCVVPVTVWPAATKRGSNRIPIAPVAPARKTFISVSSLLYLGF